MSDDRTRTADPRPDAATPPADATASDDRAANPDSTRPSSRPHGDAPAGVVSIPGYEVRGELARGGMGRVLEAYDLTFGREVAIKVVLPGPDAATTAGRFVRESRITGRLTHPGIPPAYQLGELPDGSPFLAMKLVRGRTLAQLLAERPDVGHDLPRFVSIFEQVCQAVGYAHSRGIIHRDLKPANVMVGAFGEVQVMDWGLARDTGAGAPDPDGPPVRPWDATGSTIGDDRTQAGAVMGTPAYMAPEQARGEDVDARADVFALGGLLTSVLVGRAPFASTTAESALALAGAADVSAVLDALAGCGSAAELVDIANQCLAPTPDGRPVDGTSVASLMAAYRVRVDERLRVAERERAAAEARAVEEVNTRREAEARATEQLKRRRAQLVAAAVAVLLVAGAGGAAAWRIQDVADRKAESLRLEGEEKDRQRAELVRAAVAEDGVANLLSQAEAELGAGEADRAEPFLSQAERRATDDGVVVHRDRAGTYRTALATLRDIDGVNSFRWTSIGRTYPPPAEVAARWAEVLAKYGVVPGRTPPAAAAERINLSPIRDAVIGALDSWLALAPSPSGAEIRAILSAADPDPFRSDVRRVLVERDPAAWLAIATRDEWKDQPTGLVQAVANLVGVSIEQRRNHLARLLVLRPGDYGLLMDLGATYPPGSPVGAGERVRWYQAAASTRPRNGDPLNQLGVALKDHGDVAGAGAAFRRAIELDSTAPYQRNNLGGLLRDEGKWDAAEAAFREATRLLPTFAEAHYNLGLIRYDRKDLVGAAASYRDAIRHNPSLARPHNNLGIVLAEQGERRAAEAAFREATRLDPAFAQPHNNLGVELRGRGDLTGAVAEFREAIRLDPMDAQPHFNLGVIYAARKDARGAAAEFREAIRLDPKDAEPHFRLGHLLQVSDDLPAAIVAYRGAIRLNPSDTRSHHNLGEVLYNLDDLDGAEAEFREVIRLNPGHTDAYNSLGSVLLDKGDKDGAGVAIREAIRRNPNDALYHNSLGVVLESMLDLTPAEAAYRRAIELDPGYASPQANLGDVYRQQGRHADAVVAYRAALALNPTLRDVRAELGYCLRVQRGEVPTAPPPRAVGR